MLRNLESAIRLRHGNAARWPGARGSIFNHSMNYRSVVILGTANLVQDPAENSKRSVCCPSTSSPAMGRLALSQREGVESDLLWRLPIDEFSAKVRQGPAIDDEHD